jgi:hypothetical protein
MLHNNNWTDSKSISYCAANSRVHEFFETPYFKSGIQPIPGAQMALQKLSRFCDLSIVTYVLPLILLQCVSGSAIHQLIVVCLYMFMVRSRQNAIKDHTIEWIENNFSGLFDEIHFGNHFALDGVSRPKSEICRYAT